MGNAESLRCIFGKKKFANRNNVRNTLRNLCSWVKTGQHCPQYRIARIRRISTSMSCWKCCWHCQCPTPPRQHQHLITFHYAWRDYLQRHDKLNFLPDNGPSSYPSRLARNYLEIHNSTHAACSRLLTQHLLSSMWRFWDEWFNSTAEKFVSFWITNCFCWHNLIRWRYIVQLRYVFIVPRGQIWRIRCIGKQVVAQFMDINSS